MPKTRVENSDQLKLTGLELGRVFNSRSGCMHAIHLKVSIAIVLKTRPKQHIDFLLLDIGPGFILLAFDNASR
jgi:hypothetical protein